MSRSYPIWNKINSCLYAPKDTGPCGVKGGRCGTGNKSYGVRDHSECVVHVGTSSRNSHVFVTHELKRKVRGDYTVFQFIVDGVVIKTAWLHKNEKELQFSEPASYATIAEVTA